MPALLEAKLRAGRMSRLASFDLWEQAVLAIGAGLPMTGIGLSIGTKTPPGA
jgi:hypothetical protein